MKTTKNASLLEQGMDPVLVELSGSTESYQHDMTLFLQKAKTTIEKLRSTKAGKQKLKKAGFK